MAAPIPRQLRPVVEQFAREMERRLRENDHKPGWQMDSPSDLLARLREETDELEQAIKNWTRDGAVELRGGPIMWDVAAEAADVANFALMLADLALSGGVSGLEDLHKLRARMELAA